MAWIDIIKRWIYKETSGVMTGETKAEGAWIQFAVDASDNTTDTTNEVKNNA